MFNGTNCAGMYAEHEEVQDISVDACPIYSHFIKSLEAILRDLNVGWVAFSKVSFALESGFQL